jgi:hypothetical protein
MIQEINKEILINLNSLIGYDFIKAPVLLFSDTPIFFLPIFLVVMWIYYSYSHKITFISEIHLTKNLLEKERLLYIFYATSL